MLSADSWLSSLLKKPVYQLDASALTLKAQDLPQGPALLCAKLAVDRIDDLLHLQSLQFRLLDTNVQLVRRGQPAIDVPATHGGIVVRSASVDDETAIREVARSSFEFDRFHRDPEIADEIASRIKEEWAANFFAGKRGQWMLVAEDEGRLCGFLQLLRGREDAVIIDLIAVSKSSRGRGVAKAMIVAAMEYHARPGSSMVVGTQLANIPSLGLYQGLGFQVVSASYVLHLHQRSHSL